MVRPISRHILSSLGPLLMLAVKVMERAPIPRERPQTRTSWRMTFGILEQSKPCTSNHCAGSQSMASHPATYSWDHTASGPWNFSLISPSALPITSTCLPMVQFLCLGSLSVGQFQKALSFSKRHKRISNEWPCAV